MQEIVGAMTVDYEPDYAEDENRKVIRDGEHDHRFGSEGDILGNKEKKRKRDDPGRDSGEMGQGGWKGRAGEPRKANWNGESPGRVCKPAQNRDIEWERMPTPPVSEENDIRHDDDVDDDDDDDNKLQAKKAGEGNGVAHSRPSPSTVGSREGEAIERHTRSWPNRYRVLRCNFGSQPIWQH
jgi:hypothetical protein